MEGISAPAPHRIGERKEWITSDEPATAGFAILVRTSITNAEQRQLRERLDYIIGDYSQAWSEKDPTERDLDESPRVLQRKLLASYIFDWNAEHRDINDDWQKVPPPAVAGYEAFDYILPEHMAYILDVIQDGYRYLGKAASWQSVFAAIGSSSDAKPPDADPPLSDDVPAMIVTEMPTTLPKRRKSSSTRSASVSTT